MVELSFLVRMEFVFGHGSFDLQRVLEQLLIVFLPAILMLVPNLVYGSRQILLPLSGAALVYLVAGVVMGFMALAMGPHGGGAAIFLGLIVQILTAGANFIGALELEA